MHVHPPEKPSNHPSYRITCLFINKSTYFLLTRLTNIRNIDNEPAKLSFILHRFLFVRIIILYSCIIHTHILIKQKRTQFALFISFFYFYIFEFLRSVFFFASSINPPSLLFVVSHNFEVPSIRHSNCVAALMSEQNMLFSISVPKRE